MYDDYIAHVDVLALPSVLVTEIQKIPYGYGIYFLLSRRGQIIYIGQSQSIHSRWRGHNKRAAALTFKDARIAWLSVSRRVRLEPLERAFIRKYCPPMNSPLNHAKPARSFQPYLF